MALSFKNTLMSLTLSGVLLLTGYLTSDAPIAESATSITSTSAKGSELSSATKAESVQAKVKAKRTLTTPYFSFGKSNLPAGVR